MTWSSQLPVKSWKLTLHAERGSRTRGSCTTTTPPPIEFYLFKQPRVCSCATFNKQFPKGEGILRIPVPSFCSDHRMQPLCILLLIATLGSLNLLDAESVNSISSPVVHQVLSRTSPCSRKRRRGRVNLSTCIVAKVFQRDICFIRGGSLVPLYMYTISKVSLTVSIRV